MRSNLRKLSGSSSLDPFGLARYSQIKKPAVVFKDERVKWKGEGESQNSFESACVSHIAELKIVVSSQKTLINIKNIISGLTGSSSSDLVFSGPTFFDFHAMPSWVSTASALVARAHVARIDSLSFQSTHDDDSASLELDRRGVLFCRTTQDEPRRLWISPGPDPPSHPPTGLMASIASGLASRVPASYSLLLPSSGSAPPKPGAAAAAAESSAGGAGAGAGGALLQEVVVGAEWTEHAAHVRGRQPPSSP